MKTVWKYPLEVDDYVDVEMQKGAYVLTVDIQDGRITLWALVDPEAEKVTRRFRIASTGHPITEWTPPDDGISYRRSELRYISTIVRALVFHVFEVLDVAILDEGSEPTPEPCDINGGAI